MERLRAKGSPGVADVRGCGLMVGVALDGGGARAGRVCRALLEAGWIVLTGGAEGDVLTLTFTAHGWKHERARITIRDEQLPRVSRA